MLRVAAPSGLKTVSWVLPETAFESPLLCGLLDKVMVFGGMLTVHVPPVAEQSIGSEIQFVPGALTSPLADTRGFQKKK